MNIKLKVTLVWNEIRIFRVVYQSSFILEVDIVQTSDSNIGMNINKGQILFMSTSSNRGGR